MKKMTMILAFLAALMIAGGALALTDTEAETAARAYVPAEATLTRTEMDDGMHELTFRVEATGEKYEIKVDPSTGAVVKIESELKSASNARSTTLTDEAVAAAVEAAYPGAEIVRKDEEIDDGNHEIEVFIVTDGLYGTLDLNAETSPARKLSRSSWTRMTAATSGRATPLSTAPATNLPSTRPPAIWSSGNATETQTVQSRIR